MYSEQGWSQTPSPLRHNLNRNRPGGRVEYDDCVTVPRVSCETVSHSSIRSVLPDWTRNRDNPDRRVPTVFSGTDRLHNSLSLGSSRKSRLGSSVIDPCRMTARALPALGIEKLVINAFET